MVEGVYDSKATNLVGDGLVTIESALGEAGELHTLYVPEGRKAIFYGVSHLNLMWPPVAIPDYIEWLKDNGSIDSALKPRRESFPEEDSIEVVVLKAL